MPRFELKAALIAFPALFDSAALPANALAMTVDNAFLHSVSAKPVASQFLDTRSTVGDILEHPAFAGFAPLILPWDGRDYDRAMPLTEMGTLLPYHSLVDPETVAASLNRMIDDIGKGHKVFYDLYDKAEKVDDPSKRNAGLFFFRGKPGAPFALVAPGGGFAYVGAVHEGFPYAAQISRQGYNVFVLRYRAGMGGRTATRDLAAAITYVFDNAQTLGVSTDSYSLWGSSAGARMAAFIGSHGVAAFGGADLPKPAAVMLAYTAHSDHSDSEPSTFAVVGEDDTIATASRMRRRVNALQSLGTRTELRTYRGLGHGFGPGIGTAAEGWISDAVAFWEGS